MFFSVIMQCYLGEYKKAATNREEKLFRAIDSVLNQTEQDFELIVVADGCEKTFELVSNHYMGNDKVECFLIRKQPEWSGYARNFGIEKALGDFICYIDSDDYFGERHLETIKESIEEGFDWFWFNDYVMNKQGKLVERQIYINQRFQNGTSNVCHKRSLPVKWKGNGYGFDDWSLVSQLLAYKHKKIQTPAYCVCHIPGYIDA